MLAHVHDKDDDAEEMTEIGEEAEDIHGWAGELLAESQTGRDADCLASRLVGSGEGDFRSVDSK